MPSERTPIVPERGERKSYDRGKRHHQACRSLAVSLEHFPAPLPRVIEPFALTERGADFFTRFLILSYGYLPLTSVGAER